MTQPPPRGLIVDWGGVVTQPLRECIGQWAQSENLDPARVMVALTEHITGADNPLQQLERGQLTREDVEPWLADVFATCGPRPDPQGLFHRMFSPIQTNPVMIDMLITARKKGLRTGLLSNSWGDSYDRNKWELAFDAVVISGDVGMRKPDREIFDHALSLIELSPHDVVYVDDEYPNVLAAASYGLRAIHCDPHDPQRVDRITAALAWG